MALRFTACVPGDLRYRDVAGAMIRAACIEVERGLGCAGLEWRVMSAFNEAFNNVVEHAYAQQCGDVEVALQVDDERLELRMVDHGNSFDFSHSGATIAPEFDTLSEGGMGLFIIRTVMSEVTYERRREQNQLTMIKRLSECPGGSETTGGCGDAEP